MMRYVVLGLFLALAACNEPAPPPPPAVPAVPPTVTPKRMVLIDGCEYWEFHNNHGATYAPKMTPHNVLKGQQSSGFNRCAPQ